MTLLDHGSSAETTTKKHRTGLIAALAVLAVVLVGACTSSDDAALSGSPSSGTLAGSSSFPPATAQLQEALQKDLLSAKEVAAALAEWPQADDWDAVGRQPAFSMCGVPGPAVGWHASVFYTYMRSDGRVTTDVSECMFYSADRQTIAQMFADLQDQTPSNAVGPYEPAKIGWLDAFAWELDGGGGAIDRFVVVNTGDALLGISANRHSPVAEGDNLTRLQVDHLVDAAVEKIHS